MNTAEKYLYFFGIAQDGKNLTEGDASLKNLLGGKGANLAEMAKLNVPVPPGFTLSTQACTYFNDHKKQFPESLRADVASAIEKLEAILDKKFSSEKNPLLLSVRSGARVSMPGMMDTVLNLGLNETTVQGLAEASRNERFAYDSYRRFIQMYSNVVLGLHTSLFETFLEEEKHDQGVDFDSELSVPSLKELIRKFKSVVLQETGERFPEDPLEQLWGAIQAVFESWNTSRAQHYRKMNSIPGEWGTAVNVQAMVFGNMGEDSATGVAFTRNPSTGEKYFYGEFLANAQGEDVVSGIRTPLPLLKSPESAGKSLEESMPTLFKELDAVRKKLEEHYRDMQDIEFTIEKEKLFFLQTRTGKRTAQAAVRIAREMVEENLIAKKEAVLRIDPYSLDQLLHPRLNPNHGFTPIAKGLPASPGAVTGKIVFQSQDAVNLKNASQKVILVRHETSPEDIQGMDAADGILTALGGMTSHAAVVARGMGKSCISGCSALRIDYQEKILKVVTAQNEELLFKEHDVMTIDANTGELYSGELPTLTSRLDDNFNQIMSWANEYRKLGVRANADTAHDAKTARDFGAEGIGLCRTEHMFFAPERIDAVREMILAINHEDRSLALEKILPMQKKDFVELFEVMSGLPVTIRLLDPPLHEFLPHADKDIEELSKKIGVSFEGLKKRVENLKEINPMLGHRGCRLGITFPEIYDMQAMAIAEAMVASSSSGHADAQVEVMIPLIFGKKELEILKARVKRIVDGTLEQAQKKIEYSIGTMIEIPRAAVTADEVAEVADFFSFGTNDLTQMSMGLSRDDSSRFLPEYIDRGIVEKDPFASIDQVGVGELVRIAIEKGRSQKKNLKAGVCGEHGGDPDSIDFFHKVGLDYVSCSPFRVPTALLAASQAALKEVE